MGGAAAGVLITRTIRLVGIDVYDRLMVRRQQQRVGAALGVALADGQADREAGRPVRDDGFFDAQDGLRSDSEEILEGVLLHAANAYQERKIRHLGAILPSLAVRPEIPPAGGHWLTQLADRLTWRQFVILSVFANPPEERLALWDVDHVEGQMRGPVTASVRRSRTGHNRLARSHEHGWRHRSSRRNDGHNGNHMGAPMHHWKLTTQGRVFVEVTKLDAVPNSDRQAVLAALLV
jgi:hypothetical protein